MDGAVPLDRICYADAGCRKALVPTPTRFAEPSRVGVFVLALSQAPGLMCLCNPPYWTLCLVADEELRCVFRVRGSLYRHMMLTVWTVPESQTSGGIKPANAIIAKGCIGSRSGEKDEDAI